MDLNIRNVPEVLVRELKRRALEDDESLREWVIGALERAVGTLPVPAPAVVRLNMQDVAGVVDEYFESGPDGMDGVPVFVESATIMPARAKAPHPGGDPPRIALKRPSHDQKTCRIYKCLQCAELRAPKTVK
jgi:hypothetical protein